MMRRAAIAAIALAALFAAVGARDAHAEWVTEVVTNRVEYDGVEYLQSSGTQTIKLPCVANKNNTTITIRGYVSNSNTDLFTLNPDAREYQFNMEDGATYYRWFSASAINAGANLLNVPHTYKCGIQLYMDGVLKGTSSAELSYTSSYLWIFNGTHGYSVGRVYFVNVEGANVRYILIPVLDGTTPKMLNLVDGQLYANAGTGAFTYGAVTGRVVYADIVTNRVYRAPAPMRSYDAAHPFNAPTARTRLGGTGNGEDGTTLRPTAHIAIKRNEED